MRRCAALVLALPLLLVPARAADAATCRSDVFPSSYEAYLDRTFPGQRVTAAVYDTRTRCWYQLNGSLRITTASVVKAGILANTLLRAQDAGRGLTAWEAARASPMIRLSHNPDASQLYSHNGGTAGMDALDRRLGVAHTDNVSAWGGTVTTAYDRTLTSYKLLSGGGPLAAGARGVAWRYMSTVHPTQRWGLTAGVTSPMETALKNGFYPMSGRGWRVGTTGLVRNRSTHQGYVITVMTDENPNQFAGIHLVEDVSRRVAKLLSDPGPVWARSVSRARCVQTSGSESWGHVTARLGLPASRAGEVASVSGGNAAPLAGQRACSPDLDPA
jgi:beta-lactamase class A